MKIIHLTETDLHNMVKQTVNKILKENNYKNKLNKIRAATHAYGHGNNAQDIINNMMAKQQAINDINKEINTRNNKIKKEKWDGITDLDAINKWNEYNTADNNFTNPIYYKDIDITPIEGEDILTVDY